MAEEKKKNKNIWVVVGLMVVINISIVLTIMYFHN
jgi:uncharacterized membrane protein